MSRKRLIETTVLVLVGILLAAATINDVARQTHINKRLIADLKTWRSYTGHDYHTISVEQTVLGEGTQREVVCGNTAPGAPRARTQLCLAIWGPIRDGRRTVHGRWQLPPKVEDLRSYRYACSGAAVSHLCPSGAHGPEMESAHAPVAGSTGDGGGGG